MFKKNASICITIVFCITGCYNGNDVYDQALDTIDISRTTLSYEGINTVESITTTDFEMTVLCETPVNETAYISTQDNSPSSEDKPRIHLVGSIADRSETFYLELPKDKSDIDKIKDYYALDITLFKKTDLSFIADFAHLKELSITIGEEDAVPEAWEEAYVESYDFLKKLNNVEYLRISKEPNFNTICLQNMDNLKYLHFYGTNIDFEGYFPNVEELEIAGGELSSKELYDFFPNLTGLNTYAINISLKSVGKMQKLEILHLSYCQSYSEISEIVNNKHLRALTLASKMDGYAELVEDEKFILEFNNLQYFWCLEGVISDETVDQLLEINPQCDAFNHGM